MTAIEFKRCTSVFDEAGPVQPTYNESIIKDFEADTVILAIGQAPETEFLRDVPDRKCGLMRGGWIKADPLPSRPRLQAYSREATS